MSRDQGRGDLTRRGHRDLTPRGHRDLTPRVHPPRLQHFFLIINFVLKLPRVDVTDGTVSIWVGVTVTAEVAATIESAALPLLPDESGALRFPSHHGPRHQL